MSISALLGRPLPTVFVAALVALFTACSQPQSAAPAPSAAAPVSAQSVTARVMPLGDSITDGWNIPGGYRIPLLPKLSASGLQVDLVGSMQNGPSSLADRDHEGHSGWRIDEIAAQVNGWLDQSQPDVVMLLIGTNDILQNHDRQNAPARLAALVDQITTRRPQAHVLLASLPPLTDATKNEWVRSFNAALPQIVSARVAQGKRVAFVDAGATLTTADLADGVHPNAAGHEKLATLWHDALRKVLPAPETTRTLHRAINLGGPAMTVDGLPYDAHSSGGFTFDGATYVYPAGAIPPVPATDAARTEMLRTMIYREGPLNLGVTVPNGTYDVYVYVWEDNYPETYGISVEGRTVLESYTSGPAGRWDKLGPYRATVTDGRLDVTNVGPRYAIFSGIEIWRVPTPAPQPPVVQLTRPSSGTTVTTGTPVALDATASDPDGSVARVEFLVNGTRVAEDTTAPYAASWTPTQTGTFTLTARATDASGLSTTSAPVTVTVTTSGTTLHRAINLGGPAMTVDGLPYDAHSSGGFTFTGATYVYPAGAIPPVPATDFARSEMLRTMIYREGPLNLGVTVPNGTYDVYVYVWEDNYPETYGISVEGRTVLESYTSGPAGRWDKLGPYRATVTDGRLDVTNVGPRYAIFSGIEIWRVPTPAPQPPVVQLTRPSSGTTVTTGTPVALDATASDPDGSVARVEFLVNGTRVAEDTTAPYAASWTPTQTGTFTLTARATDAGGLSTTSASATVNVTSATSTTPTFYRAVNLGGPSVTIDGRVWEGQSAPNYGFATWTFSNQNVTLTPATDTARATMIRSSVWSTQATRVTLTNVPSATYQVFLYVWEDNDSTTFDVLLEGRVVQAGVVSGAAGQWRKLGPFTVAIRDGTLEMSATPTKHANFSGIEVWRSGD